MTSIPSTTTRRGLLAAFSLAAMAGLMPRIRSTSGFSSRPMNCRA